jgi:hypothetical protein
MFTGGVEGEQHLSDVMEVDCVTTERGEGRCVCVCERQAGGTRMRRSACERRLAHERWSLGAHTETVSVRLGHNGRVRAGGGAALRMMLAARHGDPAAGVGCRAWEPSDAWAWGSRRDDRAARRSARVHAARARAQCIGT